MVAVGIDVSKGKSTVAVVTETKEKVLGPFDVSHTRKGLEELATVIRKLGDDARIVMEATGHYHDLVADSLYRAGFFVSVVNPVLVHEYGSNTVRRVKTDKKDAVKIARYCIDNWGELRAYVPLDITRSEIKIFSRQYNFLLKIIHSLENNLLTILDKTMPGIHRHFSSRKQASGKQKWVDFALEYWHIDNVAEMNCDEFREEYKTWCHRGGYQFQALKAEAIHSRCRQEAAALPKNDNTKLLVLAACNQVIGISAILAETRARMVYLSTLVPEYPEVISLYGVGDVTAAGLIAEIGDVRRFSKRSQLAAYAGVDPLPSQSGKYELRSAPTSKKGSAALRKTLFQVMCTFLRKSPAGEAVYRFLDRKRAEGKPYFVYMTASANKFLRIYYARVLRHLKRLDAEKELVEAPDVDTGGAAMLQERVQDAANITRAAMEQVETAALMQSAAILALDADGEDAAILAVNAIEQVQKAAGQMQKAAEQISHTPRTTGAGILEAARAATELERRLSQIAPTWASEADFADTENAMDNAVARTERPQDEMLLMLVASVQALEAQVHRISAQVGEAIHRTKAQHLSARADNEQTSQAQTARAPRDPQAGTI